jgi:hypothetical protein
VARAVASTLTAGAEVVRAGKPAPVGREAMPPGRAVLPAPALPPGAAGGAGASGVTAATAAGIPGGGGGGASTLAAKSNGARGEVRVTFTQANVALTTATTLTATVTKGVTPTPFTTALSLATAVTKRARPVPFTTALSLATAIQRRTRLAALTAALSLTGVGVRRISAFRSGVTALTLDVAMARSLIAVRAFSTALTLAVTGAVKMSFDVLNRIASGGTTVIKKIISIFDD